MPFFAELNTFRNYGPLIATPHGDTMKNFTELTAEQAGSSELALRIAKRVLRQPAFHDARAKMRGLSTAENDFLAVFCSYLAREIIDVELGTDGDFRQTPGERGKQDGIIAQI